MRPKLSAVESVYLAAMTVLLEGHQSRQGD